ncbi:MAG: heavy-metal-associated domain-containing protein, partial [Bacteroidetes bacterium]|nr:heavy-metal-associated domain-containing protein [Bacteroidota bacterium]
MKTQYGLAALLMLITPLFSFAQSRSSVTDTTVIIKVSGNCEMCKNRIETAAKGKGVIAAEWDVNKKILKLEYDPSTTTSQKVQERIAEAGHDTEFKLAKDYVYNDLPECCHYRDKKESSENSTSAV